MRSRRAGPPTVPSPSFAPGSPPTRPSASATPLSRFVTLGALSLTMAAAGTFLVSWGIAATTGPVTWHVEPGAIRATEWGLWGLTALSWIWVLLVRLPRLVWA